MSKRRSPGTPTSTDDPKPRRNTPPDARSLPARLLDMQGIARVVPALSPETLRRVIDHSGLDETLPLLALASREQLHQVMDLDLWRSEVAGLDEGFDISRFGAWLESLIDNGDAFAADLLARMEPTLVISALAELVRVVDLAALGSGTGSEDDEFREDAMSTGESADIGGYRVCSRETADAWDAIVAALVALETYHPRAFHQVMRGCRQLSNAGFERDGLDDLLSHRPQAWLDQQGRRLLRRERRGYVAPADARAFLRAARAVDLHAAAAPPQDLTWRAFLQASLDAEKDGVNEPQRTSTGAARELASADDSTSSAHGASRDSTSEQASAQITSEKELAQSLTYVVHVLDVEGLSSAWPRALLTSGASAHETTPQRYQCVRSRMEHVFGTDRALFERRHLELTFLANAVACGCPVHQRTLTPAEATEAATAVCNLGLEGWPRHWVRHSETADVHPPVDVLEETTLIAAFQVGWRTLFDTISTYASERLLRVLRDFSGSAHPLGADVLELRWRLSRDLKNGEPWRAADELDVLAVLDLPGWAALVGLIAEFPVMHPVLTIEPGRRILSVDPRAFTYFSEPQHLLTAHRFLDSLAARLSG